MPLSRGARLGPYELVERIGGGGMGEVYRANDLRLHRVVAVKVIADAYAEQAGWRMLFQNEARIIAGLNHPHICRLYDVGHERGVDFLVLEYLEGDTLAARTAKGALPLHEAIGYGIEIADALDCAHHHGIVHRDLKPANVMLTHESGAKVLDFGLAKLEAMAPASQEVTTMLRPATRQGALVGTLQYMSPERLEGRPADARSDIFALGLIIQEMATGRRVFDGSSQAALIAAILSEDPPAVSTMQPLAPPALDWVVQLCLAKRQEDRWQSARNVAAVLRRIASDPRVSRRPEPTPRRRWMWPLAAAAGVLAAAAVAMWMFAPAGGREAERVAFTVSPPPLGEFSMTPSSVQSPQFAVSPDGRRLVYVASTGGTPQLWLRRLDSVEARPLPHTDGAMYPFWSPASDAIGFFAQRALKRVDLSGGPSRTLADAVNGRGGTWSRDGTILFAPSTRGVLWRVAGAGGTATTVTTIDDTRGEASHRWPDFLPDGRRFTYFVQSSDPKVQGIYVGALDGPERRLLVATAFDGSYAAPGHLLYVASGALMARPLDARTMQFTGDPFQVAERVGVSSNFHAAFSASDAGVLALQQPGSAGAELVWRTRTGDAAGRIESSGGFVDFELSPDNRRLAFASVDPATGGSDVRVLDLPHGTSKDMRLTFHPSTDASPVWSPDASQIVFRSNRDGYHNLYRTLANGSGTNELLLNTGGANYATDWVADQIVYQTASATTGWDIWSLRTPDGPPRPVRKTEHDEMQAHISGDGTLMAYTSNHGGGSYEVYVTQFPVPATQCRVSASGGWDPRWRRDGKELFYVDPDGAMMAASIQSTPRLDCGPARELFKVALPWPVEPFTSNYAVTADGRRFLIKAAAEPPSIVVLLEWLSGKPPAR